MGETDLGVDEQHLKNHVPAAQRRIEASNSVEKNPSRRYVGRRLVKQPPNQGEQSAAVAEGGLRHSPLASTRRECESQIQQEIDAAAIRNLQRQLAAARDARVRDCPALFSIRPRAQRLDHQPRPVEEPVHVARASRAPEKPKLGETENKIRSLFRNARESAARPRVAATRRSSRTSNDLLQRKTIEVESGRKRVVREGRQLQRNLALRRRATVEVKAKQKTN
jgi:hypothetical protein